MAVGKCNARTEFAVAIFPMARYGKQRVFWSLIDLYAKLKLKSYKGQPSNWISRQRVSWEPYFQVDVVAFVVVCLFLLMFPRQCALRGWACVGHWRC